MSPDPPADAQALREEFIGINDGGGSLPFALRVILG
jgi:hypothetical protein